MKPIRVLVGLAIVYAFSLISCQKEVNDFALTPVINPVADDSIFISKILIIDSSTAGEDTGEVVWYYYDNLKRVTNINDSFVDPGGITTPFQFTTFSYNGLDTLPYKMYRTSQDASYRDTTTTYFYYDASGNRINDSTFRSAGDMSGNPYMQKIILSSYQFVPGKIYGYSRDTTVYESSGTYPPADITMDTASIDAADNLISNIKDQNSTLRLESTLSYNNQLNFFHMMNIRKNFDVFPKSYTDILLGTQNNTAHIISTQSGSGSSIYEKTMQFSTNADGYVSRILVTDPSYPGTFFKSLIYYVIL